MTIYYEKDERDFGAMDPEEQRETAPKGGKASHEQGIAHEFDSEEASEVGKKEEATQDDE